MKITKAISSSGLCSRRDAKKLILEGRVKVNGKALTQDDTGITVTENDKIEVDGKQIPSKIETFICLYHKPKGLIVTHNDPQGRPTIFDKLPKDMPRVISVGRLDLNSEGLLLLTNNGDLARKLEKSDLKRVYKVRVFGTPSENTINKIKKGVKIDGITYKAEEVKLPLPSTPSPSEEEGVKSPKRNTWLEVILTEGKNREIRKLFEHFNHPVSRIIRIKYGKYKLGTLKKGEIKLVSFKD